MNTIDTFTSRDGTPISCTKTGSGPPVVLVQFDCFQNHDDA
jgi:hypothetical protein